MDNNYNPNPGFNYGYDPNYAPNIPQKAPMAPEVAELAGASLTRSIVAMIFAELPLLSIIAIFLGFGAKKKAQTAMERAKQLNCECTAKATVGKILGLVSGILGILCSVIYAIYTLYFVIFVYLIASF